MTAIRVLSYNVRYASHNDHHDAWHDRRDAVGRLVRFHRPDIAAFQEPLPEQRSDLRERLPGYAFVGRGRNPGGDGEGCPIAVQTDRWEIVDDDTFWLSETPTEPSADWGAAYPRIATWARVRRTPDGDDDPRAKGDDDARTDGPDSRQELFVVNTHFDHVSVRARRESARLLRERLPELVDGATGESTSPMPVVLVGDLNCTAGSEPHQILVGDDPEADSNDSTADDRLALHSAAANADLRHGPETSLTDFANLIDSRRIDHALVSPGVDVEAFATLADRDDRGRYPSDHLPILARLDL